MSKEIQASLKEQAEIKKEISTATKEFQEKLLARTKAKKPKKKG